MRYAIASLITVFLLAAAAGCGGGEARSSNAGDAAAGEASTTASTSPAGGTTASGEGVPTVTLWGRIPQPRLPTEPVTIEASGGKKVRVEAEIADEDTERYRGLMARKTLDAGEGMLFVFGDEEPRNFTMRNTLVPLSIAYISSDGRIVSIVDMQPLTAGPYPSDKPAQYALEVPQGFFARQGVKVGDRVELPGT